MKMPQIFCEIATLDLFYVVPVKSTVEISQNFVAFSEYMNFNNLLITKSKEIKMTGKIVIINLSTS